MKTPNLLFGALLAGLSTMALAQHSPQHHAQSNPYAGDQARDIKALSQQEVKQYLSGAGMGFARAAELNRYPGPMHVLELSDQLALTPEQRKIGRAHV